MRKAGFKVDIQPLDASTPLTNPYLATP